MRFDWFKQFLMNKFDSVLGFSWISIRIGIRIPLGNLLQKSNIIVDYVIGI